VYWVVRIEIVGGVRVLLRERVGEVAEVEVVLSEIGGDEIA